MAYPNKILDRQVGRNAQLFAQAIADLDSPEQRYPYLRILIALVESAHPEWNQAPRKDRLIAGLIGQMSQQRLDVPEVAEAVRARDEERGVVYE